MIVITVARNPVKGSVVDNIICWGTGCLNIDESRIPSNPGEYDIRHYTKETCFAQAGREKKSKFQVKPQPSGRWPANIILEQIIVDDMDKQSGVSTSGVVKDSKPSYEGQSATGFLRGQSDHSNQHGGTGGASRFFKQVKK